MILQNAEKLAVVTDDDTKLILGSNDDTKNKLIVFGGGTMSLSYGPGSATELLDELDKLRDELTDKLSNESEELNRQIADAIATAHDALGAGENTSRIVQEIQANIRQEIDRLVLSYDDAVAGSQEAQHAAEAARDATQLALTGTEEAAQLANTASNQASQARDTAKNTQVVIDAAKKLVEDLKNRVVSESDSIAAMYEEIVAKNDSAAHWAQAAYEYAMIAEAGGGDDGAAQWAEAARQSALSADTSRSGAVSAQGQAVIAKNDAESAAAEAADSATLAANARFDSESFANAANESMTTAAGRATAAGQSAAAANTAKTGAETALGNATSAATRAATSETEAGKSRTAAASSATDAATAKTEAGKSATAASNSASTAKGHADAAGVSAEAARQSGVTAKNEADRSNLRANAAAGSADTAAIRANESEQFATAASASATSADTFRGQAKTFSESASTSATNADKASTAATTAQGLAVSAKNDAQGAATAASGSKDVAIAAAEASAQSATTASSRRDEAGTFAGNAKTQADNSAASANTARDHAAASGVSAQASAESSLSALAAGIALFPSDFTAGKMYFTNERGGRPLDVPTAGGNVIDNDASFGRCLETPMNATGFNVMTKGVIQYTPGKVYRVEIEFKIQSSNGNVPVSMNIGLAGIKADYVSDVISSVGPSFMATPGTVYVWSKTFASFAGAGIDTVLSASLLSRPYLRAGLRSNDGTPSVARIKSIRVADITEEWTAGERATAASGFANTASTKADDASQSATAAAKSYTDANTARTRAETAFNQASGAKEDAEAAAAVAITQAQAAARTTLGGSSKNPIFTEWSGSEASGPDGYRIGSTTGAFVTKQTGANAKYINAVGLQTANPPVSNHPVLYVRSDDHGAKDNPNLVRIRLEIELKAGNYNGAIIQAHWAGTTSRTVTFNIPDEIGSNPQMNTVQTIEVLAERPAGYVAGANGYFQVNVYASSNVGTRSYLRCHIHRLDWEEVNNNAVASMTMKTQAELNGITSATYGMRVKGNGANASFEMVALSSPAGSASAIRMAADDLILDASVKAKHLIVGDGNNLLNNTDFSQGLLHWQKAQSSTIGSNTVLDLRPPSTGGNYAGTTYPTAFLYCTTTNTNGFADMRGIPLRKSGGNVLTAIGYPCEPGDVIEFSAGLSIHRVRQGQMRLIFYDASGAQIEDRWLVDLPEGAGSSSTNPDIWPRYGRVNTAVAPAGAAFVVPVIRMRGVVEGQTNSYIFVHKPYLGKSKIGAELSPYAPGGQTIIDGGSIDTTSLSAISAVIGILRTATSGARQEIHSDKILIYDASNVLRVRIGNLVS